MIMQIHPGLLPLRVSRWLRCARVAVIASGGLAFGIGCAGPGATPGWVNGESPAQYPREAFVTALASGTDLSTAQSAAKAELSRIFSAELASEIRLIDEETVVAGESVQGSEFTSDLRISTDVVLEGVEAPLHWRDPRTGGVWALAVLERQTECRRIRSEGQDRISELEGQLREAREAASPLAALRAGRQAVASSVALDALQARSRVLGIQCLPARPVSTGQLRADVATRLAALSFVVEAMDIDPDTGRPVAPLAQLREQIAGNLTRMGFRVGPSSGARVIPVRAELRLRRVRRATDWVEFRWEGAAEIGGGAGGGALIAAESEGSESHPESSTARLRARRKGELDLSRQLDRRLEAYLAGSAAR